MARPKSGRVFRRFFAYPLEVDLATEVTESTENLMSDPLTEQIIGAAIEVHRLLGPGLLESIYEEALCRELGLRGIEIEHQVEGEGSKNPLSFSLSNPFRGCRLATSAPGSHASRGNLGLDY